MQEGKVLGTRVLVPNLCLQSKLTLLTWEQTVLLMELIHTTNFE